MPTNNCLNLTVTGTVFQDGQLAIIGVAILVFTSKNSIKLLLAPSGHPETGHHTLEKYESQAGGLRHKRNKL